MVAMLSLGLGAAAATLAICQTVLWRAPGSIPPERLVWIESATPTTMGQSSPGSFALWRTRARTLSSVAAMRPVTAAYVDRFGADRVRGALATVNLFDAVGIRAAVGRTFAASDEEPGSTPVLISYRLWQRRYAADASVTNQRLDLNGSAAVIVGVLPRDAEAILGEAEWCAPLRLTALDAANFGPRYLDVVGQLEPLASLEQAAAELDTLMTEAPSTTSDEAVRAAVTPLLQHQTAGFANGLVLLLVGVGLLALIAVVNAASLLVARTNDRAAEFALRACLGASRHRRARLLIAEATMVGAIALSAGLVTALWFVDVLRAVLPANIPRLAATELDLRTALFVLVAGALAALAVGLVPALRAGRAEVQLLARSTIRLTGDRRVDGGLVVAQVCLSVVLACSAGLMIRSARALDTAPRGYDARNVYTTSLAYPRTVYQDGAAIIGGVNRLLTAVGQIPGVQSASVSSQIPFAGGSAGSDVQLANAPGEASDRQARVRLVSAGYLTALGIRLREGREIGEGDAGTSARVVVVNEALARRLMPGGGSLVGREVTFGVPVFNGADGTQRWTIVGVAADTWDRGPRQAVEPEVLIPLAQTPPEVFFWISGELQLAVRTSRHASEITAQVRSIAAATGTGVALGVPRTLEERLGEAFARERVLASILSALGVAGLALSLLGLAGLIYHRVQRSRGEIAVRLAIGASTGDVVRRLTLSGTALVAAGVVSGLAIVIAGAPLAAALLFGIQPDDPLTLGSVAALVLAVSVVAAWLPARLAAAVAPSELLRS